MMVKRIVVCVLLIAAACGVMAGDAFVDGNGVLIVNKAGPKSE